MTQTEQLVEDGVASTGATSIGLGFHRSEQPVASLHTLFIGLVRQN